MTTPGDQIHEGSIVTGQLFNEPIRDPARFFWQEVIKVAHYWLEVNAMTRPMMVREGSLLLMSNHARK